MTYELLKFGHIAGAVLLGAGLIGVFMADLRSRQLRDLPLFAEAVRTIAVCYDGLVVPGAILLAGSGIWMIVTLYDGWAFFDTPWLAGMVLLFVFEFVEGNTITRLYFIRLRRAARRALEVGEPSDELERIRRETAPIFTHFLDLPMFFLIVSLGAVRPTTWTHFIVGSVAAVLAAAILTIVLPRLYPWIPRSAARSPD